MQSMLGTRNPLPYSKVNELSYHNLIFKEIHLRQNEIWV